MFRYFLISSVFYWYPKANPYLVYCSHKHFEDTQLCLAIKGRAFTIGAVATASSSRNPMQWLHGQGQFLPQVHSCSCQKFANCVQNCNFIFQLVTKNDIKKKCNSRHSRPACPNIWRLLRSALTHGKTATKWNNPENTRGSGAGETDVDVWDPDFVLPSLHLFWANTCLLQSVEASRIFALLVHF